MFKFSFREYILLFSFLLALNLQYYLIEKHSLKQELLSIYSIHDYDLFLKFINIFFFGSTLVLFLLSFILLEKLQLTLKAILNSFLFGLSLPFVLIIIPMLFLPLLSPFITTFWLLPFAIIIVNLIYKAGEWLNRKLS